MTDLSYSYLHSKNRAASGVSKNDHQNCFISHGVFYSDAPEIQLFLQEEILAKTLI